MNDQWQTGTFLLYSQHEEYLRGEHTHPAALLTRKQAFQQFNVLFGFITLPIILMISGLVRLAGQRIELLLPILIMSGIAICLYLVYRRYRRDNKLRNKGQVVYGRIVQREELPIYPSATGTITRLIYTFQPPDHDPVYDRFDLMYPVDRLPDGRKFPESGTLIAVLYADRKTYFLL